MARHSFYRISTSILILLSFFSAQAQTAVDEGAEAFLKNDRKLAFSKLNEALKTPELKKKALLWLTLLCENDESLGSAPEYFRQFYKEEKNVAPYAFALWSSTASNYKKKSTDELSLMEGIANRPDIDGSLKAMAYASIGTHYQTIRQKSNSESNFNKIGALSNWMLTGEFENISGSGFDKQYDPISHPEASASFKNKYGASVGWFVPPFWRRDNWVDFDYYFSY